MRGNDYALACALIFVFLFSGPAFALTINTDANSVEKGSSLLISGNSDMGTVKLKLFSGDWLVQETSAITDTNYFEFEFVPEYTVPSGYWKAVSEQNGRKAEALFKVENSPEAAFILIKILSPSKKIFSATEKISIGTKLTDAGKDVERAAVFAWVPKMGKIHLSETKPGFYSKDIVLPPTIPPGNYNIVLTAEKAFSHDKEYGGENILEIQVVRPEIILNIVRPAVSEVIVGKRVEILVLPEYSTGITAEEIEISASIGEEEISFIKTGEGFSAEFVPEDSGKEKITLLIFAVDSFGNTGQKELELRLTGFEQSFLEKNLWWIGILCVLLAIVLGSAVYYCKKVRCRKGKSDRAKEIKLKIKNLEDSFYKNAGIDRKTFENTMADYREELEELNSKN